MVVSRPGRNCDGGHAGNPISRALSGRGVRVDILASDALTWLQGHSDQGKEMSQHQQLTERTGVAVFFADPHSPWQRGSNENTNGLLRQYLRKGQDLSGYSQDDLNAIARKLNTRPRKLHSFRTP